MSESTGTPGGTAERPALFFADAAEWRWLAAHHDTAPELWMGLWKKDSGRGGITWAEAVREASAGDGSTAAPSASTTRPDASGGPAPQGSTWSAVNVRAVEELTAQGRMQPSGLAAFALRREDRTGRTPSSSPQPSSRPSRRPPSPPTRGRRVLGRRDPGYRKTVTHWLQDAKQQATRDKRLAELVEDCGGPARQVPALRHAAADWVARAAAAAEAARGS